MATAGLRLGEDSTTGAVNDLQHCLEQRHLQHCAPASTSGTARASHNPVPQQSSQWEFRLHGSPEPRADRQWYRHLGSAVCELRLRRDGRSGLV